MMMSFRRMVPFLLLNVIVSAVVVLSILYWWDGRTQTPTETARATAVAAVTPVATEVVIALVHGEPTGEAAAAANELPVHTVKAGETLGSISQFYNVSLDDIVQMNNLANPNILQVGQQLTIPVGGIPTPTPQPTPTPTVHVIPSPIPTEQMSQGEAKIEISEVIGNGRLTEEAVRISNLGTRAIALVGWKLVDEQGHTYTFGQVTLFGDGAAILVHTEAGRDGASDLYWGLEQAIWQPGETVLLLDAEGTIQAKYVVGNQ
jgi:LysM repeat protein